MKLPYGYVLIDDEIVIHEERADIVRSIFILRGGEPVFIWNGIAYGVCFSDIGYCIAHIDGSCEKICSTPDAVLEYMVGSDRLRDVITQVTVISRSV